MICLKKFHLWVALGLASLDIASVFRFLYSPYKLVLSKAEI